MHIHLNLEEENKMVNFKIDNDTQEIIRSLYKFIDKEILPLEEKHKEVLDPRNYYQKDGRITAEALELKRKVRMRSSELGFYNMFGPEELGGGGLGAQTALFVSEALAHRYGPNHELIEKELIPSSFTNGVSPVLKGLKQEYQEKYLPDILSGEKTLCFALTEPDAGSDIWNIQTKAVKDGDHWVLNGTKQWITNAPYADYALVFAITDPEAKEARKGGITAFFLETNTPGFDVTSIIPIMGNLGGIHGIISLENVCVHESQIIGELHDGFKRALGGISAGRLTLAGRCCGIAQWALDKAIDYSKERVSMKKKLTEHQMIQQLMAECALDIYTNKNAAINCAWQVDEGRTPVKEIAMIKWGCTEMVNRVVDKVIQIHGGMGVSNELELEEAYRMIRPMRIFDGTSEIHKRTVARQLVLGNKSF